MTKMRPMRAMAAGLLVMTACVDMDLEPEGGEAEELNEGADLDEDVAGGPVEYLFGWTEEELLSIYPLVREHRDRDSWLARNRAPFRCASYGDFCALVGEEAAQDITREALAMAFEGASLEEIVAATDEATAVAREIEASKPTDGTLRASTYGTDEYDCNNHRLRTEVFNVDPPFGARYGEVTCRHQTDLGSGIWGGQNTAEMEAYVRLVDRWHEDGLAQGLAHSLTSPRVTPQGYETVEGTCTGYHSGDTRVRTLYQD